MFTIFQYLIDTCLLVKRLRWNWNILGWLLMECILIWFISTHPMYHFAGNIWCDCCCRKWVITLFSIGDWWRGTIVSFEKIISLLVGKRIFTIFQWIYMNDRFSGLSIFIISNSVSDWHVNALLCHRLNTF